MIHLFWFFSLASIEFSLPIMLCHRQYLVRGERIGQIGFLGSSIGQAFGLFFLFFSPVDFIFKWSQLAILLYLLGTLLTLRIFFSLYSKFELPGMFQETSGTLKTAFLQSLLLSLLNPIMFLSNSDFVLMATTYISESKVPFFLVFFFLVSFNFLFHNSIAWILQGMIRFRTRTTRQSFQSTSIFWGRGIELIGICVGTLGVISCSWHFLFHYPLEFMPTVSRPINHIMEEGKVDKELRPGFFGQRAFQHPKVETGIVNRDLYFVQTINKYWPAEKFRVRRKQNWDPSSIKNFNNHFDSYASNEFETFLMSKIRNNATPKEIRVTDMDLYEQYMAERLSVLPDTYELEPHRQQKENRGKIRRNQGGDEHFFTLKF
jgi:hypothetical protein